MTCHRCPNPGRPYLGYLSHRPRMWCDECAASAKAMGAELTPVERRVTDLPVTHERRRFNPPWLRNLTAREDGTWRTAA